MYPEVYPPVCGLGEEFGQGESLGVFRRSIVLHVKRSRAKERESPLQKMQCSVGLQGRRESRTGGAVECSSLPTSPHGLSPRATATQTDRFNWENMAADAATNSKRTADEIDQLDFQRKFTRYVWARGHRRPGYADSCIWDTASTVESDKAPLETAAPAEDSDDDDDVGPMPMPASADGPTAAKRRRSACSLLIKSSDSAGLLASIQL